MKKLMNVVVLSCQKSSELIEKKLLSNLTVIERIQLNMHTSMCKVCKSWEKQSGELDLILKNSIHAYPKKDDSNQNFLSEEVKESIIKKMKEE